MRRWEQSFETGFEGCTLENVNYDAQRSYAAAAEYLQYRDPALIDNTIVLFADFTTDGNQTVREPNATYTNFMFILQREDADSPWVIIDGGY